jgi:hypothetical protein
VRGKFTLQRVQPIHVAAKLIQRRGAITPDSPLEDPAALSKARYGGNGPKNAAAARFEIAGMKFQF